MDLTTLAFLQFLCLFLSVGALILMLILLVIALIQAGPAMNARNWASTNGMVIKTFISSRADDENPKSAKLWYVPNVSYTYFVQGTQFVAQRIYFGAPKTRERSSAEKELAAFPVGGTVTVFYNPEMPASAVLQRRAPNANKLFAIAFGVFLLGTFFCAMVFLLPTWTS